MGVKGRRGGNNVGSVGTGCDGQAHPCLGVGWVGGWVVWNAEAGQREGVPLQKAPKTATQPPAQPLASRTQFQLASFWSLSKYASLREPSHKHGWMGVWERGEGADQVGMLECGGGADQASPHGHATRQQRNSQQPTLSAHLCHHIVILRLVGLAGGAAHVGSNSSRTRDQVGSTCVQRQAHWGRPHGSMAAGIANTRPAAAAVWLLVLPPHGQQQGLHEGWRRRRMGSSRCGMTGGVAIAWAAAGAA
eukprot:364764-Chlamydomonas_euryale.AAC.10